MKFGLNVQLLLSVLVLPLLIVPSIADPPPEDVLRPEPDPSGYFFLQPHLGLNYSFLTSERIRPLFGDINETTNSVIESGSGLGLLLGLDIGYVWNEHFATRLGFQFDQRRFGNQGTAVNECILRDRSDTSIVLDTMQLDVDMEYAVTGNYFTIALMQDFRWESFYATLGLATSIPVASRYYETDQILDTASPCFYLPFQADSTRRIGGELHNDPSFEQQFSLKLGVGYIRELGESTDLVIQVNYDHPFNSLFAAADTIALRNEEVEGSRSVVGFVDPEARFGTIQAMIGVRINLSDL